MHISELPLTSYFNNDDYITLTIYTFTSQSFVVPLTCRDRLARTTRLPACQLMDTAHERPACAIGEQNDTRTVFFVARISGTAQVCWKEI